MKGKLVCYKLRGFSLGFRFSASLLAALALTGCGAAPEKDVIYQALRSSPPTEIPPTHLAKLRRGAVACDVYNQGRVDQYMTCWWPSGLPSSKAYLSYYRPNPVAPPNPAQISVPGGDAVTTYIPIP